MICIINYMAYWQAWQDRFPAKKSHAATSVLNRMLLEAVVQKTVKMIELPQKFQRMCHIVDDKTYAKSIDILVESGTIIVEHKQKNQLDCTIISLRNLSESYTEAYTQSYTEGDTDSYFPREHTHTYARACAELVVTSIVNKGNTVVKETIVNSNRRIDASDENFEVPKVSTHPTQPLVSFTDRQPPIDNQVSTIEEEVKNNNATTSDDDVEDYATINNELFTRNNFVDRIKSLFAGQNGERFRQQEGFNPLTGLDTFLTIRKKDKRFVDDYDLIRQYTLWVVDGHKRDMDHPKKVQLNTEKPKPVNKPDDPHKNDWKKTHPYYASNYRYE